MIKIKRIVLFVIFIMSALIFQNGLSVSANEYIVKPKSTVQLFSMQEEVHLQPLIPELSIYTVKDIEALNPKLYEFIEEDVKVELFDTYDYSAAVKQKEYAITGMEKVWDTGIYGKGIRIGVIDSGCNQHERLLHCLKGGASFVDGVYDTTDNIGHGTAVCGVIAADYGGDNVLGIARRAEIVPLKFIDRNEEGRTVGGTTSRLAKAIVSAVDDFDCNVINMSCGTISSETLRLAVEYAASKGVIMTAAVGNNGNESIYYPAAYDDVIGVGAVDNTKQHSSFSNTNDSVFITAPGNNLNLLSGTADMIQSSGTSFSTPYVSGIVADMLAIKPDITSEELFNIITETSEDLGEEGYDTIYGYGLIRADKITNSLLKDCKCFTTGVDLCDADGLYEIRFRLNNSKDIPTFILAEYAEGILNHLITEPHQLRDNIFMLRVDKMNKKAGEFKYFVWNSLESMMPF